jgi:hypothetical protein
LSSHKDIEIEEYDQSQIIESNIKKDFPEISNDNFK